MYAWRGRIGFISPTTAARCSRSGTGTRLRASRSFRPSSAFARATGRPLKPGSSAPKNSPRSIKLAGCNVIAVSGSPPVLLKGLDFEREWGDRLAQKLGIPVVTQMEPHALALVALGVKRVAVATYYGDELNQAIVRYFRRFDIDAVALGGYAHGAGGADALYTTSLQGLDAVSHSEVYQYCKRGIELLSAPVDGIYINGGGWDALPAITPLEVDLGTKVVFALAAEMWRTYKALKVDLRLDDCGALFRTA